MLRQEEDTTITSCPSSTWQTNISITTSLKPTITGISSPQGHSSTCKMSTLIGEICREWRLGAQSLFPTLTEWRDRSCWWASWPPNMQEERHTYSSLRFWRSSRNGWSKRNTSWEVSWCGTATGTKRTVARSATPVWNDHINHIWCIHLSSPLIIVMVDHNALKIDFLSLVRRQVGLRVKI